MVRIIIYLYVISVSSMGLVYASAKPEEATKIEKKAEKEPDTKSLSPQTIDNKELKQGDLQIDLSKTKELIAQDKALLTVAEKNYNDSMTFIDNPLERQKMARKYKNEIRLLKQRIATHEGMVKKWDQQLIETTGKLKDS